MTHRRRTVVVALVGSGIALLGACTEILGVEDIPNRLPDSGVDATRRDSGRRDARGDARPDAGRDATPPCALGTTRCSENGLSMEACGVDGGWLAPLACAGDTPLCLGGTCACAPGTTRCVSQTFERCTVPDGGAPAWPPAGTDCHGTCTLTGCGAFPPSCGIPDGGTPVGAGSGVTNCPRRDAGTESCCTSDEAPGGSFDLSYDGVSNTVSTNRATVSPFRLDRFEVTVGRFRRFLAAVAPADGGAPWAPSPGSGKHAHLNGGQGLFDRGSDGGLGYEPGWNPKWNAQLWASTSSPYTIGNGPNCPPASRTWTPDLGTQEDLPMNCLTWVQAYAFCIWDGGFLPSEAEWNFAAAGGSDQRVYPWSESLAARMTSDAGPIDAGASCNRANTEGCEAGVSAAQTVGGRPLGDSKWLQADMAGNVAEWTLDVYGLYAATCVDCTNLGAPAMGPDPIRVRRGGAFVGLGQDVLASYRGYDSQSDGDYTGGVRCARSP